MDAELLKLLLSVVSAVVAVVGAFAAHRTRHQARQDLFDTQKDLLLLTAAENTARLRSIEFEAQWLQKQLTELSTLDGSSTESGAGDRLLAGLSDLVNVLRSLEGRDWTQGEVENESYSEAAILKLRKYVLAEQVIARTLQTEAHAILLQEARSHLQRPPSAA